MSLHLNTTHAMTDSGSNLIPNSLVAAYGIPDRTTYQLGNLNGIGSGTTLGHTPLLFATPMATDNKLHVYSYPKDAIWGTNPSHSSSQHQLLDDSPLKRPSPSSTYQRSNHQFTSHSKTHLHYDATPTTSQEPL